MLHFGVAGSHRVPDSASDVMRVSSRAENALSSQFAVDTGASGVSNVDHVRQIGVEAAAAFGPASLQGEYVRADYARERGSPDVAFSGYYAEASYFLTGESRSYDTREARFGRTKPRNPFSFSKGGWGAWQVAARYSVLDLNDAPVLAGELRDLTFGLKWVPHANVMLSANYIKADTDANAVTPNDSPDIWLLRTQVDF